MTSESSLDFLQKLNSAGDQQQQQYHQQPQQVQQHQASSQQVPISNQQQVIPHQVVNSEGHTPELGVYTLLASHFSLIGERLKDISANIEKHLRNGDQPNIDRSLDTLLDTILYVSNVLVLLFKSIPELQNNDSTENIDKELIDLAVFHLTSALILKLPPKQPSPQGGYPQDQPQQRPTQQQYHN